MTTTYRVHFPGITRDFSRDFTTEAEAIAFRNRTRDHAGNMWRHVRLEVVDGQCPDCGISGYSTVKGCAQPRGCCGSAVL